MDQGSVLSIGRQALEVALMVALPILGVALLIGVAVSVFQAVTQVQEATLTFVPKLVGLGLMFTFIGGWMISTLVHFMQTCFDHVAKFGR